MKPSIALLSFALSAIVTVPASRAQIIVTNVVDTITYDSFLSTGLGYSEVSITPSDPVTSVSWDFSTLGDTTVQIFWAAPENMAFQLVVPDAAVWNHYRDMYGSFDANGSGAVLASLSTTGGMTFYGSSAASLPAGSTDVRISELDASMDMLSISPQSDQIAGSQTYRFTSVGASFVVPASFNGVIDASIDPFTNLTFEMEGGVSGYTYTDPGDYLTLVSAIPEPTTCGLVVLGGLALGYSLARRKRRSHTGCDA